MSLSSDQLVDRRRLQRRVSFWRVAAFLALAVAVVVVGWRLSGRGGPGTLVPHIARLSIDGVITGDRETIKLIHDIEVSNASAMIVSIESPGGTTTGAERLYDAIRRVAAKKPTVAVVRGLAASGGYIAAIGADHIVAQGNSLVGSIGVLFQFPNVSVALDKIGVKVETIKSSPLKASPNGFEPTTPAAQAAMAALVTDSYDWFKALVKARRAMSDQDLAVVSDGRVFTGRQGVGLHLVDGLGEEREAIAYLESRGVTKGLPVRDWKKTAGLGGLTLFSMASGAASAMGLTGLAGVIDQGSKAAEIHALDGLLAVWQIQDD
ncbi:signal peptide peptidase SppA [Beijerinckia sp. L45]|uniref:signal peptide peptidase SppA n=1 Tax=Beijerinckia sp. L45 TaxID=1641855 RepID=UPI00131BA5EC|nr:signal peptide peptidase SppA [Beijerinckia sp. L45]